MFAKSKIIAAHANLDRVTLVAVTSVAIPATTDALRASMAQANFSQVLLLSDKRPPAGVEPAIEWRQIAPIPGAIRRRPMHDTLLARYKIKVFLSKSVVCAPKPDF